MLFHQRARHCPAELATLHRLHPAWTRFGDDSVIALIALQQGREAGAGQRARGGKHAHDTRTRGGHGRLYRRLHADDGNGKIFPQGFHGRGRRRVAGNDNRVRSLLQQKLRQLHGTRLDIMRRLLAVGHMGGIGHVDEVGMWQQRTNLVQHRNPAHSGIEDTHRQTRRRHRVPSLDFDFAGAGFHPNRVRLTRPCALNSTPSSSNRMRCKR